MLKIMDLFEIILFIFPAYVANSAPVLLSGWGPLDANLKFLDGKRLFGDSKTIRGTFGGIAAGMIVGALFAYFVPSYLVNVELLETKLMITALMVVGALIGDLLGSFFKRRLDIQPGEPLFVTDQLLFIIMAIALSTIPQGFFLTIYDLGVILIITLVVHIVANRIAHALNLKKVPW